MRLIREALTDFIDLVYPLVCITCQETLKKHEGPVCTHCRMGLPKTDYHLRQDNEMAVKFYGKVPVQFALSYLLYVKQGKAQKLVHALKYKGQEQLGHSLGLWYGHDLKAAGFGEVFEQVTCVPLHASRLRVRGYNQAASFARGLAEGLELPFYPELLTRNVATTTQTKKGRFERYQNVKDIFVVTRTDLAAGKHILVADDVVTTGSTLEACVASLYQGGAGKVSVAAIATA